MSLRIERITSVIATAATYDLVDLETVKDELQIKPSDTSKDRWLCRAIRQISSSVAGYTKRVFAPEVLQDVIQFGRDPFPGARFNGDNELPLTRWPILAVMSVTQALPNGNTKILVEGVDFTVDADTGRLLRLKSDGRIERWESFPLTVTYTAGFGALTTTTVTVPPSFQAALFVDKDFSCTQSVAYASGVALAQVPANPAQGQYSLTVGVGDFPSAQLYGFNPADAGQVLTVAYATFRVPDDLVDACLQLITGRSAARGRDPALIQRDTPGVGTERFWFGGTPGQSGQFPPDIEAMLDRYRTPTVA